MSDDTKHPEEMPDDILLSLGFRKKDSPYSGGKSWTHKRGCGRFYHHILTPSQVADALIEIGHGEFRRRAAAALSSLEMNED